MPFIPAANTVRAEMIYDFRTQICENVFYWEFPADPSAADMGILASKLKDWYNVDGKVVHSNQVTLTKIKLTNLTTITSTVLEYTTGLPIAGTIVTGTVLPNNVAVVVKWGTALRGRSFRGRTYHFGFGTNEVSANSITSAFSAALNLRYTALTALAMTPQPALVVASFNAAGVPRANAVLTPITSLSINLTLDSQRRRLPERGS